MQHVQNFSSLPGQKQAISPLRISVVQPASWERLKAKVDQVLSRDTVAEIVFGTVTTVLASGLLFSFVRALMQYTIIPAP